MSQDELVDILDENGKILKVTTKKEAHENGLLHKCVISKVIDSQGRWLVVLQSKNKQDAGQYVFPVGGHIVTNESEIDALKREANEELGLKEEFKFKYINKIIFKRDVIGRKENHLFILYEIYSDTKPVLNHESDSYKYFIEDELRNELKTNPKQFGDPFHFIVKNIFPNLL